jgi:hypothetical protein
VITGVIIFLHVAFDAVFGWSMLNLSRHQRYWTETLLAAILAGMYAETLSIASLLFLGLTLGRAVSITAAAMIAATVAGFYKGRHNSPQLLPERWKWFEWLSLAFIAEAVLFAVWQLARTPTYFSDALQQWSGRSRSLYGQVNWSLDPLSPFFLARQIGNKDYPLLTVIWRAVSGKLNGSWTEVVSRADGLVFFIVITATIWVAVCRFSNNRGLAAAAGAVVATVPLQVWHAAAGYSDIAVEAFVVSSLAALLRKEWFLAGIMAAGAAWSKNDALFFYVPALIAAVTLIQWRKAGHFLGGFATITPWLVFNYFHGLGTTSGRAAITWHSEAPGLLWNALVENPSSGILWISLFSCLIYSAVSMFGDKAGRGLIAAFSISIGAIFFVFSASGAFEFLNNETTIHRVMMQFSGPAILIAAYGLWLKTPRDERRKMKKVAADENFCVKGSPL